MSQYLLHAEYCAGPFYMGWWLYIDPIVDGRARYSKRFVDDGGSRWIHGDPDGNTRRIVAIAKTLGVSLPEYHRYKDDTAEDFASAFPSGILIDGRTADDLEWGSARVAPDGLKDGWPYGAEPEPLTAPRQGGGVA
jgi:hypothetical protein